MINHRMNMLISVLFSCQLNNGTNNASRWIKTFSIHSSKKEDEWHPTSDTPLPVEVGPVKATFPPGHWPRGNWMALCSQVAVMPLFSLTIMMSSGIQIISMTSLNYFSKQQAGNKDLLDCRIGMCSGDKQRSSLLGYGAILRAAQQWTRLPHRHSTAANCTLL